MHVIMLSGGSGARLWPLSNEIRSKQFLKVFEHEGAKESMIQRMCRMMRQAAPDVKITVATSAAQVPQIRYQLGASVDISVEPSRRDTFPAIALACAYLKKNGADEDEPIVVCPVDPNVEEGYFHCLKKVSENVLAGSSKLTLMGITPESPSEGYGYILRDGERVCGFTEKPSAKNAETYIAEGALWNGGVFGFHLGYMLDIAASLWGITTYDEMYARYDTLEKISFDYAVVEKESQISVIQYTGKWQDIGSWDTFSELVTTNDGDSVRIADCRNTTVINELKRPIVVLSIDNAVVAATPDGILVADKQLSSRVKQYVRRERPMCEQCSWGEYRILDFDTQSSGCHRHTRQLTIQKGSRLPYRLHRERCETWTVVQGSGRALLDDRVIPVEAGDAISVRPNVKHTLIADTELQIIEVQLGLALDDAEQDERDFPGMT